MMEPFYEIHVFYNNEFIEKLTNRTFNTVEAAQKYFEHSIKHSTTSYAIEEGYVFRIARLDTTYYT